MTPQEIAERLGAKRNGSGWMARCPAHDDRPREHRPRRRVVATYDYTDPEGDLRYQVVRTDPKGFYQRRPDGKGGWLKGRGGVERTLYRLPEVLTAVAAGRRVFIVEGEKDADAIAREWDPCAATCGPEGAGNWRYVTDVARVALTDAYVTVIADKDDAGYKHAAEVAESLRGVAAEVELLEAGIGKDAAEHIGAGKRYDELVPVELHETHEPASGLTERLLSSLIDWPEFWATDHNATDYLVEPVLASGRSHSLTSAPKAGKSLLALYICAGAAMGRPVFGTRPERPLTVLYVDQEMTRADLQERLSDLGYGPDDDLSRLHYFQLSALRPLDTQEGADELLDMVAEVAPDLVVIDTLSRVIEGEENEADTYADLARFTLTPLKAREVAVLRLDHAGHENKRARGSSAKAADIDVAWFLEATDDGVKLTATHRRIGWIPQQITLKRHTEPLRFSVQEGSWPAGTKAAADQLDALEVPPEWGRTKVRQRLSEAGVSMDTNVLAAALRFRRQPSRQPDSVIEDSLARHPETGHD